MATQPSQILIVRHAEKPNDGQDVNLAPRGYARAAALVNFFGASFNTPDFLFTTKDSHNSDRPLETLTPLATALHMTLSADIKDADFATLAQQLLTDPQYADKTIIICWHHGNIPDLAKALGVTDPPSPWPGSVFDRVWNIQYANGAVTFANLPQRVLFGDSQQ